MKNKLSNKPYFLFLFPFFFVIHGYSEYYQFIHFPQLLPFLAGTLTASVLLWLIFARLLKSSLKGALMSIYILAFYLLFGALFDFLKANSPWVFMYRFRTLVSAFLLVGILLFIYLRKTEEAPAKTAFFLNLLLVIYLIVDLGVIISKQLNVQNQQLILNRNPGNGIIPDGCKKPDIYLLLFDGNASTYALKELFRYNNSGFDSFLVSRNFQLLPCSRSNYPVTPASMASMLNMDYIHWFNPDIPVTHRDYVQFGIQIRDNEVINFLSGNGYEIVNYSIFDLKKNPSPVNQRWKTLNANMLSQGTFLLRFTEEFHNQLINNAIVRKWLPVFAYGDQLDNNDFCLEATLKESGIQRERPKFVYTHILAPHFPYYKDRNGKLLPRKEIEKQVWENTPNNHYTDYLYYTNNQIRNLIQRIQENSNGKAVILLLGDHGYHLATPADKQHLIFNNLSAVYIPDQQYKLYYDSLTNVNQFRILFNTLFDQQYPLLKDSVVKFK